MRGISIRLSKLDKDPCTWDCQCFHLVRATAVLKIDHYRWFSVTLQGGHVDAQNNSKLGLMFCIIAEANYLKAFLSFALCTNVAVMTSGENHLQQIET